MTCIFSRTIRWPLFLAAALSGLFVIPLAVGLERPDPAELDALRQNPVEFRLRQEQAMVFGDHKVKPWIAERMAAKLKALDAGDGPHNLPPPDWQGMPTTGTNKILVFLIDFPDYPHVNAYEVFTNKLFGAGVPGEFPLESLWKFYERSSYGKLTIQGSVFGWYRMQHPRSWYTTTYGMGNQCNYEIIKEVVDHFDEDCDYTQFDNNGDGLIDYFAVLWSGPDNGWANFWWGYQWELASDLTRDNVQFKSFSWQWESRPVGSIYKAEVIIHETGHALGLPDYYDYDGSVGPDGGVGGMDMMAANYCDHNCFSKFMLDWLVPTVVTNDLNDFPLRESADYPDAVALARGYTGTSPYAEYFMVQNRQKINNDKNLPGAGLVVWHVNAGLNLAGKNFVFNNSYTSLKLLKLVQADGLDEIEREGGGTANAGDFYVAGKEFTPESVPNSHAYSGSNTEVRVTDISASGATMTADFSAEDNRAVVSSDPVYVVEAESTDVTVTLLRPPPAPVSLVVRYVSGSTNLTLVGTDSFAFSPDDWDVPQTLTFASAPDGDSEHDRALFRIHDTAGVVQDTDVVVQQNDLGDMVPPQCVISARVNGTRTEITFTLTFDETIQGLEQGDLLLSNNISGGASVVGLDDVTGFGRQFEARVACADVLGAVTLTLPAGAVVDLGNNPNPETSCIYALPSVRTDFSDDFDAITSTWTRSTNDYQTFTTVGWKWGPPVFDAALWKGPDAAYSGSNCWGIMDGPFGKRLEAWIESPAIRVGPHPVLRFALWVGSEAGYVEVNNGEGWFNVTPEGYYSTTASAWQDQVISLDDAVFGDRVIGVRFRSRNSAMYVDDVRVESQVRPGVCLLSVTPTNGVAGSTVPLALTVYNSSTSTWSGVVGYVSSPDRGVAVSGGAPVSYGPLAPGEAGTNVSAVSMTLGTTNEFASPRVQLFHQTRQNRTVLSDDAASFYVEGVATATNLLTVRSLSGVTNGFGQYLAGDGGPDACLFQVISAGADGVANAPGANGQTTGDDRLLCGAEGNESWGRFGEGPDVPMNAGRFSKVLIHSLPSNSLVYVRAWDAASFAAAAAYGDSAMRVVRLAANETLDFGSWSVDRPANYPASSLAALGDRDGDSIPDGWCVAYGVNPDRPITGLGASAEVAGMVTGLNRPGRVAVSSKWVFIADTENSRIEVWDRALTNRWLRFGGPGAAVSNQFDRPQGLAVDAAGTRLLVADTMNYRVSLFDVDPVTANLTYRSGFGVAGSSEGAFFLAPYDVAFTAGDAFFVVDSHPSLTCNHRVHSYPSMIDPGTLIGGEAGAGNGLFNRPLGAAVATNGVLYVADSGNSLIQAFSAAGSPLWQFGGAGTNLSQFKQARGVGVGLRGRVYVADTVNSRLQVFDVSEAPAVKCLGSFGANGALGGQFKIPQGVAPATDDGSVYVADTYNNRVQKLRLTFDGDGDGMDDVWEDLNGLDSQDPLDAFADPDGDGVTNIGEYRLKLNPHNSDSNGNGASDGWDLAHGLNPAVTGGAVINPPRVTITSDAGGGVKIPGSVVRVTATFSGAITNAPAPTLTLSGGASLWRAGMTMASSSNWFYDYVVQPGDTGSVDASVEGAVGVNGYSLDPDPTGVSGLFTVAAISLEITRLSALPTALEWAAVPGGVYQIQTTTNLLPNVWMDWGGVTSAVGGACVWTNEEPPTNAATFFRVRWMNAP